MIIRDGHIHTPFCPHGSADTLASYCEQAISLGLKTITFAEHAPLPAGFSDPTPNQDSAMAASDLNAYLQETRAIKKEYAHALDVLIGLEVDYIFGYEAETKALLNEVGPSLDDSILSVHFLKVGGHYRCIDYSPEEFAAIAADLGSTNALYALYYDTVLASICADLGPYKPKRIGHITLCKKFQKLYQAEQSFGQEVGAILAAIHENGLQLDYNYAGLTKPYCGESYPPKEIALQAKTMGIPLVYGSDAHSAAGLRMF